MPTIDIKAALVTGASAGLGAEFARQLAAGGSDVVLVARREDRLAAVASELEGKYGVKVEAFPADLSKNEEIDRVAARIAAGPALDLLVNDAGFGERAGFAAEEVGPMIDMLQVHVRAPLVLGKAALGGMMSRGRGGIINVASIAAFAPYSWAPYGATKAFLVAFSQSLAFELAGTGVRVQALCPGFVYTELHDVIGFDRSRYPRFMWMHTEPVVRASLRAFERGKEICIPGLGNKAIAAALRCQPAAYLMRAGARLPFVRRKLLR